jgi:hypothetical protein
VAQLRGLNCEVGQGFFFSQAVERELAAALIAGPLPWPAAS